MPKYVLAYHGQPDIKDREQGAAHMEAWKAWLASLGDAVEDAGTPVGTSKTITASGVSEGGGANPISGISVLRATSLDDAIEMAKACPHLTGSGSIEIAEAMEM